MLWVLPENILLNTSSVVGITAAAAAATILLTHIYGPIIAAYKRCFH